MSRITDNAVKKKLVGHCLVNCQLVRRWLIVEGNFLAKFPCAQTSSFRLPSTFLPEKAKRPRTSIVDLLDLLDSRLHFLHNVLRQGSIAELARHLLAVGDHPIQKIDDDLPFFRVLSLHRNQQPGKAGDGYAVLPGAFVMETRKSAGIFGDEAAASVTASREAFTKLPAAFLTDPNVILFSTA